MRIGTSLPGVRSESIPGIVRPPRLAAVAPHTFVLALLVAAIGLMAGCEKGEVHAPAASPPGPPRVSVELFELAPSELRWEVGLTGQVNAKYLVTITPEIDGVVSSVEFEEGKPVSKGDVLFVLRNAEREARLREAEARMALAKDVYDRTQRLTSEDISSMATRAEAKAGLDEAPAHLDLARISDEVEREAEATGIFKGIRSDLFLNKPQLEVPIDRLRSVKITADLNKGFGQGFGLERMFEIAEAHLTPAGGYRVTFSGEAEKFFESGSALVFSYLLAILIVFRVLAAQFESFLYPVAILVAVFLSFTGALVALEAMDISLNLFSKIGIVMLVGLVTKNSILIVEFANQSRERGLPLLEATLEASRARFRPILMTALATMVGILPIAAGSGAGGSTRQGLGVAVIGGMLFSTALTFFFVPATYIMLERLRGWRGATSPVASGGIDGVAAGVAARGTMNLPGRGA